MAIREMAATPKAWDLYLTTEYRKRNKEKEGYHMEDDNNYTKLPGKSGSPIGQAGPLAQMPTPSFEAINKIIDDEVVDFINLHAPKNWQPPQVNPETIENVLLCQINDTLEMHNAAILNKNRKYKILSAFPNHVVEKLLRGFYPIKRLVLGGGGDEVGIYQWDGPKQGLYDTDLDAVKRLARRFKRNASERDLDEIIAQLRRELLPVPLNDDPDLIAVNNGIFNYRTKTLSPFSPELVFISKSKVNYNPNARNNVIHNPEDNTDFDLESWMNGLSDNPEIVNLLWEILGACIRPNVPWNKSAWLYSEKGNNGKGTLCVLIQNLCGEGTYSSINIKQFNEDVFLENLPTLSAVIADENEPGIYLDGVTKLKAAITGDTISINRKYRSKLSFKFRGFIVQCMNEFPKVKDRTSSFQRRLLLIPMTKCFTGCERTYIKEDYLYRSEVLEFALYRVLNMNYYELSEPQECRNALAEYKEYNNPLMAYWNEFKDRFAWDLLPFRFLYDLYKAWHQDCYPSGKPLGRDVFCRELKAIVSNDSAWEVLESPRAPGNKMDRPEPLSLEYGLGKWQNKGYGGANIDIRCTPMNLASTYRGLVRKTAPASGGIGADDETAD